MTLPTWSTNPVSIARALSGMSSLRQAGMTPQAPWTMNWTMKAPMPSMTAVWLYAQSEIAGRTRRAMTIMTQRLPNFCDSAPARILPRIAAKL
jgi:hypothetical protein